MSDETTLLPCPFCGGEAAIVPTLDTTVREWFVTCGNLECNVLACHTKRYYTEAEAIAAWNTRADYHGYEQAAIEAWKSIKTWNTRAERTCRNKARYGNFKCDVCNAFLQLTDFDEEPMLTVDGVGYIPSYCPNCGAKVVSV